MPKNVNIFGEGLTKATLHTAAYKDADSEYLFLKALADCCFIGYGDAIKTTVIVNNAKIKDLIYDCLIPLERI